MMTTRTAPLGLMGLLILATACSSNQQPGSVSEPSEQPAVAATGHATAIAPNGAHKLSAPAAFAAHASNAELRELAASHNIGFNSAGQAQIKVFYEVPFGHAADVVPSTANVIPRSTGGRIRTADVTPEGLLELAAHSSVLRIELGRRMAILNDVSAADSSIQTTYSTGGGTAPLAFATAGSPAAISFAYTPTKTGNLTIKMSKGPSAALSAPGLNMVSTIKVCMNQTCTGGGATIATGTDNDGGHDAHVTFAATNGTQVWIHCSAVITVPDAGPAGPYPFALTWVGESQNGYAIGTKAKATGNDGSGVIVGLVDTGIDFCHPDFIDPITHKTRIKYLWDQSISPTGGQHSPAEYPGYGVEFTANDINNTLALCGTQDGGVLSPVPTQDTGDAHGSHTSGTAAGNGQGTKDQTHWPAGTFAGGAPKADIIMVNSFDQGSLGNQPTDNRGLAGYDEGVEYVHTRAQQMSKPVVLSNSWGGWGGPQDGTSLEEQFLSGMAGAGSIPVFAGGNMGTDRIRGFSPAAVPAIGVADPFRIQSYQCGPQPNDAGSAGTCGSRPLDFWIDGNDAYTITLTGLDSTTHTWDTSALNMTTATNGTVQGYVIPAYGDTAPESNGLREVYLAIPKATAVTTSVESWNVVMTRKTGSTGTGKWDLFLGPGQNISVAIADQTATSTNDSASHLRRTLEPNGTRYWYRSTVGSPSTGFGILAVGATTGSLRYYDNVTQDDEPYDTPYTFPDLGNFTYFSSRGPTRDGRAYPQISAPGMNVVSTLSRWAQVDPTAVHADGMHQAMSGTSMATPNASGAIALMLQQDPTNFPRPLVIKSATHDAITQDNVLLPADAGVALSQGWQGRGRMNAVAALAALAGDTAPTASNLTVTPSSAIPGATVTLGVTAHDTNSGDAGLAEFLWDVNGDSYTDVFTTTNAGSFTIPVGSLPGPYTASVTVVDSAGRTAIVSKTWTVLTPPPVDGGLDAAGDANGSGDGSVIVVGDASVDTGAVDSGTDAAVPHDAAAPHDANTPVDATAPVDSGYDAGTKTDANIPSVDAGPPPADSGADASPSNPGDANGGKGCGCVTAGAKTDNTNAGIFSALAGLALVWRSRKRNVANSNSKK